MRADIAVFRSRDPNGLCAKVTADQIEQFTDVDYELPIAPDMLINSDASAVDKGFTQLQTLVCEVSSLRRPIFLQTNKR